MNFFKSTIFNQAKLCFLNYSVTRGMNFFEKLAHRALEASKLEEKLAEDAEVVLNRKLLKIEKKVQEALDKKKRALLEAEDNEAREKQRLISEASAMEEEVSKSRRIRKEKAISNKNLAENIKKNLIGDPNEQA